jgi:thymidylate synthase ThyX
MNIPLFRVQGDQTLQQRLFIENIIKYHHQFQLINQSRNEFYNMTYPASKITILTYTMNLEDFHKLFLGRIKQSGNEQEVIDITKRMATLLHSKYPQFIQSVDFYLNSNNNQKYLTNNSSIELIDDSSIDSIQLIGKSKLTNEADRLFKRLNILYGNDFQRLAEFRSRLTYLSFSKIHSNENNQKIYLNKILNEHGHLSILDASQAIF